MSQLPPPPDHVPTPPSGQIPPPAPGLATDPHPGRTIVESSRALLKQDRSLTFLPLIGGFCSLLASLPLVLAQVVFSGQSALQYVLYALTVLVGTTITTFFAVALAAGATARMDGEDPTYSSCVGTAARNLGSIVQWALFATTVGLILRVIESKLSGLASLVLRVAGDAAFAAASYFVVPMLVHERIGPIDALKKSATTVGAQWRKALRFNLRLGLLTVFTYFATGALLVASILNLAGVLSANQVSNVEFIRGVAFVVASVVVLVWSLFHIYALSIYGRTALYRFAVGRPVPGFSTEALRNAAKVSRIGSRLDRR